MVRTISIPEPRGPEPIACVGDLLRWCSSSNNLLPTSFFVDAKGVRPIFGGTRGEGDTFKYSLRWNGKFAGVCGDPTGRESNCKGVYPVEGIVEERPGELGGNGPGPDAGASVGVGGTTSTSIPPSFSSLLGASTIVEDCEGRRDPPPISPIVVIVEAKLPD